MERSLRALEALVDGAGAIARWCCLALVLLVAGNVALRYVAGIGHPAIDELEWHLVSPIALLGMAYALRRDAHVRVDVFYERFPGRLQAAVNLLTAVLTLLFGGYLAWLGLQYAGVSYSRGEGSPDGGLPMRYVLKAFIPLGFALLSLQALAILLRDLRRLLGRPGAP